MTTTRRAVGDGPPPGHRVARVVLVQSAPGPTRVGSSGSSLAGRSAGARRRRGPRPRPARPYAASMARRGGRRAAAPRTGRPRRGGSEHARRPASTIGLKSKTTALSSGPITTASPSAAPELEQPVLDAEPVEPVGEEADGLVVGEVGLPDPALGLLPRTRQPVRVVLDGEVGTRRRAPAGGSRSGCASATGPSRRGPRRRPRPSRTTARGDPRGSPRRSGTTCRPRCLEVVDDDVGQLPAVGHVDLVERDQPRPVLEAAVRRELVLDDVEVGDRVAVRLHRRHVDDVHQRGAALDVAQEVVAEAAALAGALDQPGHVGDGERVSPAVTTPRFGTRVVNG